MLRDYREWLEAEAAGGDAFAQRARERLASETANLLCVEVELPLARRVLTSFEMLDQQSTALRPEFAELREAIRAALDEAVAPPPAEREPLEREFI